MQDSNENSVFRYTDTASSRAGIAAIAQKLEIGSVAIVGLGGTGSYILDLVAKTPVREIHLFDGDRFGQHNAFRAPGAPSIETLRIRTREVRVLSRHLLEYAWQHLRPRASRRRLSRHAGRRELRLRRRGQRRCEKAGGRDSCWTPMCLLSTWEWAWTPGDAALLGQLRVTAVTAETRDHVDSTIPLKSGPDDDEYASNIQIADLNALNAALAVVRWKKMFGFYSDLEREHSSLYQIDGNHLINEHQR